MKAGISKLRKTKWFWHKWITTIRSTGNGQKILPADRMLSVRGFKPALQELEFQ
jgi:hypothetical protein